jgi:hypothetical protein
MRREKRLVDEQLLIFTKHLSYLVRKLDKEGVSDAELVQELIYTARQYINRRNKAKKL